ncbi:acyltransferase family protein [Rhodoferax bucti]|uniref:acyltransferase family protein n=1 Tax=Rhodoferax bucti TaxID=2576305 RepID=UPI001109DA75|nr:acyltransferase [Rhodoferax bucti]
MKESRTTVHLVPRLSFLDCMRGAAVLMVMLTHFAEGRIPFFYTVNNSYVQLGQAGVSIFFLISGYIIPRSISSARSLKVFWIHRFFRLFPIYWCSILLACALAYFGLMRLPQNLKVSEIFVNFSMLQGFVGSKNVIGVFWSLKFELVFYFLMTAIAFARLMKHSFYICLAYSVGIALVAFWMYFVQGKYFAYGLFHIQLMLIGWVVSEAQERSSSQKQTGVVIGVGVMVAILTAFTSFNGRDASAAGGALTLTPMLSAWLFGLLVFLLAVSFRRSLFWPKWLSWVGQISYSAYLLHVLVQFVLTPYLRDWGLLAIPLMLAFSFLLAWIGYRFVELPSIAFGKRVSFFWSSDKTQISAGAIK